MSADKTADNLLADLNPEQIQAVTHRAGPLLIVAGAGTGKTTVITRRLSWLIEQGLAKPEQILALTFTDKAAQEMEERVDCLLPMGYVDIWVTTFHSFAERVLKDYALEIGLPNDFKILNQTEQWMLVRNNLDKFALEYYRPLGNPTRFIHALLQHFSRAKDEEITPDQYMEFARSQTLNSGAVEFVKRKRKTKNKSAKLKKSDQATDLLPVGELAEDDAVRLNEVAQAYRIYQQLLLDRGVLDFGDLITYVLQLFRRRPQVLALFRRRFKYLLVDEFQDTNHAQYELIKLLAAPVNNVTVVGDDDQSVYKFRGASLSNILEFKRDYPQSREIFLTTNYRSGQNILDLSYAFIKQNDPYRLEAKLAATAKNKLSKKLTAKRSERGMIELLSYQTADDEARGVVDKIVELQKKLKLSWKDFAILVRANSSAGVFLRELKSRQLPFDYVASKGLYQEPIVLEIISYLKLLDNYHETEALYRVLSSETFALPPSDLSTLVNYAKRRTVSLYQSLQARSALNLSNAGLVICQKLEDNLARHSQLAKDKNISELYVRIVEDLGFNERLIHPANARQALLLTSFYRRLQRFEEDSLSRTLKDFLIYLNLELEAGEEGELPTNYEEGPDTVKVITVHSAKGLEWPYVFLVQLVDRRFPSTERREPIELPSQLIKEILPAGDVHLQEERRLFYVGLTRARDGIFLTYAKDYFGKTIRKPSRFLYELNLLSEPKLPPAKTAVVMPKPVVLVKQTAVYPIPKSFSFSSISAFYKCPLEYKYRYLLNLPAPGTAAMSFGITIHSTLEKFLRLWQQRQGAQQGNLFSQAAAQVTLPTFADLLSFYQAAWVDDWYDNAADKQKYRTERGPKQLKNFYDVFVKTLPRPKYLEKSFKLGLGDYKFTGKIDRLDQTPQGLVIIDYKTGGEARRNLNKVDHDQLIIYQMAAEQFLREKVAGAFYWYLEPNQQTELFLADSVDQAALVQEYLAIIENIIQTIKTDSFAQADARAPQHDCRYTKMGLL